MKSDDAHLTDADYTGSDDSEDYAAPGTAKCAMAECSTRILPTYKYCCRSHAEQSGAVEGYPPIIVSAANSSRQQVVPTTTILVQQPEKDNWDFKATEVESSTGLKTAEFPPPKDWKKRRVVPEPVWFVRPEDAEPDHKKSDNPMTKDAIIFTNSDPR